MTLLWLKCGNINYYFTDNYENINYSNIEYISTYYEIEDISLDSTEKNTETTINFLISDEYLQEFESITNIEQIKAQLFLYDNINHTAEELFNGYIANLIINDTYLTIKLKSMALDKYRYPLEIMTCACLHKLYSPECGVDKNNYKMNITNMISSVSGNIINLNTSIPNYSNYTYGYVEHYGFSYYITSCEALKLTLANDFYYKQNEQIILYQGCKKTMSDCRRFSNNRFFGFLTVPKNNPTQGEFV